MIGLTPVVEFLKHLEEGEGNVILYSTIVEAELFSFPNLTEQEKEYFEDLLTIGEVIEVDSSIARKAGELRIISQNFYSKKMKLPDAIVAATAMEHSAMLVTRNEKDFNHLIKNGLKIYNPV